MNPWGYTEYLNFIRGCMNSALKTKGFSPLQAFSYAHNELSVRLDDYPNEVPLALVGLVVCASDYLNGAKLEVDEFFMLEFTRNIKEPFVSAAVSGIDMADTERFLSDLEKGKELLYPSDTRD